MLDWENFTDWLENNILKKESSFSYQLRPEAENKYSITEKEELTRVLTNWILSQRENSTYQVNQTHHFLPIIDSDEDENEIVPKSFYKLFPSRNNCLFGRLDNEEIPSEKVYFLLAEIYEDWWSEGKNLKWLEKNEIDIDGKDIIAELLIKKLDEDKELTQRVQEWLTCYNGLSEKCKEGELAEKAEKHQQLLTKLQSFTHKKEVKQIYWNNFSKEKIFGGLVIVGVLLLVFYLIRRYFF